MAHRPWVQVSMACFCVAEQEVSQPAARPNLPGRKKTKTKKTFPGRGFICLCSFFCCVAGFFLQLAEHCSLPALKACKRGAKGVCVCVCVCVCFFFFIRPPSFPHLAPFSSWVGSESLGGWEVVFRLFFSCAACARWVENLPSQVACAPPSSLRASGPRKKKIPPYTEFHTGGKVSGRKKAPRENNQAKRPPSPSFTLGRRRIPTPRFELRRLAGLYLGGSCTP